jgi:CRP/FNR family transcriptional regulator, cyclic AMP receptor protein
MNSAALRSVAFLKDLSDDEFLTFAALLQHAEVKNGETIIEEGREVNAVYIVCDGIVHAKRRAQKRNVLLGRLGEGAFFGEMNLFDLGIATATITAAAKTTLAIAPYKALRAFMDSNPATGYKITSALLREVSRRLRFANERLIQSVYWKSGDSGQ